VAEENIHKGHRQKVKQRFLANGLAGESDHNILELLLFYAIPYKDTNPIAHALIDRFGSLSGVLRASPAELQSVKGVTENAAVLLRLVLPVYEAYIDDLLRRPTLPETTAEIVEFMRPKFIGSVSEKAYLLCLGANHRLLGVRKISDGGLTDVTVDLRSLAAVVLETKAQDVILIHNHPNGIAAPSADDVAATREIFAFLEKLNVRLVNHIILSEDGYCSMIDKLKFVHLFHAAEPLI
jgi:DNA repair protein RadC